MTDTVLSGGVLDDITTAITDICGSGVPDMVITSGEPLTSSGLRTIGWMGPVESLAALGIAMAEVLGTYEAGEMMQGCLVKRTGPAGHVTITFPEWGNEG